jgi:hypothetical protein
MDTTKIALFRGKKIRKTIFQNEWWFCINDIVIALTGSTDPGQYFKRMKSRDIELKKLISRGGVQFVPPLMLEMKTLGGDQKMYCWNTEGIFRLIQSIPSPKAEPFKRWLAKVGYERMQEIENPELATQRTRILYKLKGYSADWIEKRMRGITIREELTDEWHQRGADEKRDYGILTAEISKATFGITPSEYKKLKGIQRENLRDHMDDFELIFTMLGERSTTEIHRTEKSRGVPKLKLDASRGGKIAGIARKELEKEIGHTIVSKKNYLPKQKKLK